MRGAEARRPALGAGSAARLEQEAWPGRSRLAADPAVVQDDETAIEEFPHIDPHARIRAGAAQLHPALAEADGVVAGDDAGIATAHDEGEIPGGAPPHGLAGGRGLGEAAIEIGDEGR